ncbi:putative cleavage polyadenylation specificity factor [Paratrimastix pyriformis]|uniref:Cleavage polyadenylation specificity factor n=1 Tax=Paratrimastix pyriformis TaxID=342808 RepID=A0ABQ8UEC4_9EUKA|nr:putative cleavage polyadenylation specificity factor [Paratrimastix pyriformis]
MTQLAQILQQGPSAALQSSNPVIAAAAAKAAAIVAGIESGVIPPPPGLAPPPPPPPPMAPAYPPPLPAAPVTPPPPGGLTPEILAEIVVMNVAAWPETHEGLRGMVLRQVAGLPGEPERAGFGRAMREHLDVVTHYFPYLAQPFLQPSSAFAPTTPPHPGPPTTPPPPPEAVPRPPELDPGRRQMEAMRKLREDMGLLAARRLLGCLEVMIPVLGTGGHGRPPSSAGKATALHTRRHVVLARYAASQPLDGAFVGELKKYWLTDCVGRMELALLWLHQEYTAISPAAAADNDDSNSNIPPPVPPRYAQLLPHLLEAMLGALQHEDPKTQLAFAQFCLEAPSLAVPEVMTLLARMCHEATWSVLGLATLRYATLLRPAVRGRTLPLLLELVTDEAEELRKNAVQVLVNRLFHIPALREPILAHALGLLNRLLTANQTPAAGGATTPPPPSSSEDGAAAKDDLEDGKDKADKDKDSGNKPGEIATMSDAQVGIYMQLYLALCAKDESLLKGIFDIYAQVAKPIRRVMLQPGHLTPLLKAIGPVAPTLLSIIRSCPAGREPLVLRCLQLLTESGPPPIALTDAVLQLYTQRVTDARLLVPIVHGLPKSQLLQHLPALLNLPQNLVQVVLTKLLDLPPAQPPVAGAPRELATILPHQQFTPVELVVAIHAIQPTQVNPKDGLKRLMEAVQLCLTRREVFPQDKLAVMLQRLVDTQPLPVMIMRTTMNCLSLAPTMLAFVFEGILPQLVRLQVWRQPRLWEGFVRCCVRYEPHSYPICLRLPPAQLADILTRFPKLKSSLREYAAAHQIQLPMDIQGVLNTPDPIAPLVEASSMGPSGGGGEDAS